MHLQVGRISASEGQRPVDWFWFDGSIQNLCGRSGVHGCHEVRTCSTGPKHPPPTHTCACHPHPCYMYVCGALLITATCTSYACNVLHINLGCTHCSYLLALIVMYVHYLCLLPADSLLSPPATQSTSVVREASVSKTHTGHSSSGRHCSTAVAHIAWTPSSVLNAHCSDCMQMYAFVPVCTNVAISHVCGVSLYVGGSVWCDVRWCDVV